jgi:hypothetical protein
MDFLRLSTVTKFETSYEFQTKNQTSFEKNKKKTIGFAD